MNNTKKFIGIIQEHEGLIYKVTKVYSNSKEDEQDLYQEIVYQLWKSFPSFRNDSKISTWMYRVALNTALTYLYKEKRRGNQIPLHEVMIHKSGTTALYKEEQLKLLYDLIKKLNQVEKGIILLYLEGKSYEEIAAITGFTASNVGTKLGRIKQKMIILIKK